MEYISIIYSVQRTHCQFIHIWKKNSKRQICMRHKECIWNISKYIWWKEQLAWFMFVIRFNMLERSFIGISLCHYNTLLFQMHFKFVGKSTSAIENLFLISSSTNALICEQWKMFVHFISLAWTKFWNAVNYSKMRWLMSNEWRAHSNLVLVIFDIQRHEIEWMQYMVMPNHHMFQYNAHQLIAYIHKRENTF